MKYFIFILMYTFIAFLFTLYSYARDDFILFRKNIDMERVFNLAFLVGIGGLFFARLFYVILYFNPLYLNPLAFVLFPYFPGLSLPGGILGSSIILSMLLRGKKFPEGRMFDFFVSAMLISSALGAIGTFILIYLTTRSVSLVIIIQTVFSLLIYFIASKAVKNHAIKEGSNGLISLLILSICFILSFTASRPFDMSSFIKESIPWIVILVLSFFFFLKQDNVGSFLKFLKGKK